MPSVDVTCPACKKPHTFTDLLPFRAECEACAADLHVCLSCRHHDRYVENACREDQADPVAVKDRRNLCEYWKPILAGASEDDAAVVAKAKLAALFGDRSQLAPVTSSPISAADDAKRKLEDLFRKK